MKINKLALTLIIIIIVFLTGLFIGFYLKPATNQGNPLDLNLFPQSCTYQGQTFKSGETVPAGDGCNSCSCEDGQVVCTTMACE